jgi:hypothetical protein
VPGTGVGFEFWFRNRDRNVLSRATINGPDHHRYL